MARTLYVAALLDYNPLMRQLGKYQLQERLGRGGMAEVYKAWHPTLERHVAVKLLHPHLAATPGFLERFRREAKAVAQLHHPHIVQVFDFDCADDVFYMVMEYVAGPTLKEHLDTTFERGTRLAWPEVRRIFGALLSAVDYAHTQGMIHRDLKPGNILLDETNPVEPRPVLTDFGIAKMLGAERLTQTGATVGTPTYISPEQALGEEGDTRSDLYALGVILFECLSGQVPYDAPTSPALLLKHVNAPIPSLHTLVPECPAALEGIIQRALAKAPEARFQTANDFWLALQAVDDEGVTPNHNRVVRPKRLGRFSGGGLAKLAGGALLVALLVIAGWAFINLRPGQAQPALATAQAQTIEGDYQLAVDSYTTALAVDPQNAPALLGRAWAYEQLGQVEDALTDYQQLLVQQPTHARARAELARMALQYDTGLSLTEAFAEFNFAVEQAPAEDQARVLYLRGWAVFNFPLVAEAPNPTAALPDLRAAAAHDLQNAEYQFTLAQALLAVSDPAAALQAANRAVELAPNRAFQYKFRATVQFVLGDYFAVLDDLTAALTHETAPASAATLYAERAYINALLHRTPAAEADLAAALAQAPASEIALLTQARLDATQPRPTAETLQRAQAQAPDDPIWQAIIAGLLADS